MEEQLKPYDFSDFKSLSEAVYEDTEKLNDYLESEYFNKLCDQMPYYYCFKSFYDGDDICENFVNFKQVIDFFNTIYKYISYREISKIMELDDEIIFKILIRCCSELNSSDILLESMLDNEDTNQEYYDIFFGSISILDKNILKIYCENDNFRIIWPVFDAQIKNLSKDKLKIINKNATVDFIEELECSGIMPV